MLKITIKGPQGSGKGWLAEKIKGLIEDEFPTNIIGRRPQVLVHDDELEPLKSTRIPYSKKHYDVVIMTEQGEPVEIERKPRKP